MLILLLALPLLSNCFADASYIFLGAPLYFSPKDKAYLTQSCDLGKCEALRILEASKKLDLSTLPRSDSRHDGAKACEKLGGKTALAKKDKSGDELCVCVTDDRSAVSCSRLAI